MVGISARASHIYRSNKAAMAHYNTFAAKERQKTWNWRQEWSKAMKEACSFMKRTAIAAAAMIAAKSAESKKKGEDDEIASRDYRLQRKAVRKAVDRKSC